MHNCIRGEKNILKSWAVRAGAWTAWELVMAGSWLGYRYLRGFLIHEYIWSDAVVCAKQTYILPERVFYAQSKQVLNCSELCHRVCALLSPPAFCLFLLETVEMQIGVTTKKISYNNNNNNTVFQISGKKNLYPQAHAILLDQLYIYNVTRARSCSPTKEMSNKWWTCS
jgi:hypothetical protein